MTVEYAIQLEKVNGILNNSEYSEYLDGLDERARFALASMENFRRIKSDLLETRKAS